jgi:transcriptional regulator with XRE-family HTH domain
MLDEIVADRATFEPDALERWASIKLVQDICEVRIKRGMTQADVAKKMGVPQPRVADIERRPWSPSLSRIFAYAQAVGVEVGIVSEAKAA